MNHCGIRGTILGAGRGGLWMVAAAVGQLACSAVSASDWPMWRCDAGRTASCAERLPDELHLQWVRRLPPQVPAWKDEPGMQFDAGYQPVILGGLIFVGSTVNDRLTAYDLASGAERWRFYTEGPIRVAPAAWKDRVLVGCDDGCLYCLRATDGKLSWRFRGGPSDRRLIGNQRLISTWPVRGGPVVDEATVYFTAGLWPFMGTFVYALEANSGRVVWVNDSTSFTFRRLPHYGSAAFSGLSPQGHLALAGEKLIVPGSRLTPAVFDRSDGTFLFYARGNGPRVAAAGRFAFAGRQVFDVNQGTSVRLQQAGRFAARVLTDAAWYGSSEILDPATIRLRETTVPEPHADVPMKLLTGSIAKPGSIRGTAWLAAGSRLVVTHEGRLQVLDVAPKTDPPAVVCQADVPGSPVSVLAGGGRLIAVTREGGIYCFGARAKKPGDYSPEAPTEVGSRAWSQEASPILAAAGAAEGYCMVWGLKDGGLVEELLRQSKLHVIAVDRDPAKVENLRRRLDAAGMYGTRAAALVGDPAQIAFAPYLASLITCEDPRAAGVEQGVRFAARLFHPLRPYGGSACLVLSPGLRARFAEWAGEAGLPGARLEQSGELTLLVRAGPLPGSAPWLGQNADAGNTRSSRDTLVMAPLGVLWFGNALSNRLILPRHGEGPVEQVCGGRMFIEGPESISASDVYTGRLLWTRRFAGLGRYYDSVKHQPGAHSIGGNFYAVPDAVYVSAGQSCHVLDPATGRTHKELKLPGGSDWQFLMVYDGLLIAGADPVIDSEQPPQRMYSPTSSRRLVAMDRRSGKVLWTRKANKSFRHYGICAGRGKVFCIDRLSVESLKKADRRGQTPNDPARAYALDARTGHVLWETDRFVGPGLSYSEQYDVLLSNAAFRGEDGQLLWHDAEKEDYLWFGKWGPMINGDEVFPQVRRCFDLLTGEQRRRQDPRGRNLEWKYQRSHGCGPMAGSTHLITFRSACAGFLDLKHDGGTGTLGGFRSGCTSNLIVADGVLNAPDYTRTCTCPYQNRSSLGLVNMKDAEYWTYGADHAPGRAGFNFGAPGDRRCARGTLWRAVPNVADRMARDGTLWWGNEDARDESYSGKLLAATGPRQAETYYHHCSRVVGGEGWNWVAASGVRGLSEAKVPLVGIDTRKRVLLRLCFCEPEHTRPGSRVFSVSLDGREILTKFDIVEHAGGAWRSVVKEFSGIRASGRRMEGVPCIELSFHPMAGQPLLCGVEVLEAGQQSGGDHSGPP